MCNRILSVILVLALLISVSPKQAMAISHEHDIPEQTEAGKPAVPSDSSGVVYDSFGEITGDVIYDSQQYPVFAETAVWSSAEEAIVYLRQQFVARQEQVTLSFRQSGPAKTDEELRALSRSMIDEAQAHTGVPEEGDYIAYHIAGWSASLYSYDGSGDETIYQFTYTFHYRSTAQQEAAVAEVIASFLSENAVYTMTDYEKAKAVYDFICPDATYDYTYSKYTAYHAAVEKNAVCQGFALLFYRLALEVGLDARIITGIGNGGAHAWNIVRINGLYYNVDATWDVNYAEAGWDYFNFFLKCPDNFTDHIRDEAFLGSFETVYPMSPIDYVLTEADLSIGLDAANFPDYYFRNYLYQNYDMDKNWKLSPQEIASVTQITAPDNISSLKGIEHFYNLERIICTYENITEVDLSGNPKLNYVSFQGCPLKKLDLSSNPLIAYVSCGYNGTLEELNISGCRKITDLNAYQTKLKLLDVRHCYSLKSLNVEESALQELLVGTHPYLTSLYVSYNQIRQLDVTGCPQLGWLMVGYNRLEYLDLSKATKLQYLECNSNCLTNLDLSACTNLQRSQVAGNVYTVTASASTFNLFSLPGFEVSKASNWVGGSVSEHTLTIDPEAYCVTYHYDCGNGRTAGFTILLEDREMPEELPINSVNFPDYYFRKMISSEFDTDKNGKLSYAERAVVSEVSNGYEDYTSMKGIEYFFNAEFIFAFGAKLTEIDLSQNPWLVYVDLGCNSIKKLDISNHKQLNYLSVYENWALTQIDVSGCTNLVKLGVEGNQLTTLDLRGLSKLQSLTASHNQLTSITFGYHYLLSTLEVAYNQLTDLEIGFAQNLKRLMVNDNGLTSLNVSVCTALESLNVQNNKLTQLDLSQNHRLKWLWVSKNNLSSLNLSLWYSLTGFDHAANRYEIDLNGGNTYDLSTLPGNFQVSKTSNWVGGSVSGNILTVNADAQFVTYTYMAQSGYPIEFTLDLTGRMPDTMLALNAENFPDPSFRQFLSDDYDLDKDGYLNYMELAGVTQIGIRITGTNSCSFEGIQHFFNLEQLNIGGSPVYSLDLSGNPKLSEVSIYNTYISEIDLSHNPLIDYFACWDCPISQIDFSNNPNLRTVYVSGTDISQLDLSAQTKLQDLYADEMPNLKKLDLQGCSALQLLDCHDSAVETLILGNHPNLWYLHAGNNAVRTLNLGGCPALENLFVSFNQIERLDLSGCQNLQYCDVNNNRLTSLNLPEGLVLTRFSGAANAYTVQLAQGRTVDLNTLPGNFDITKISNIRGATLNGSILTVNLGVSQVVYTYDCGNGLTVDFTLHCACDVHQFGEWQLIRPNICTFNGMEKRICSLCHAEQTRVPDMEPTHVPVLKNVLDANCMQEGYTGDTFCQECGTLLEMGVATPALGHELVYRSVDPTCTASGYTEASCIRCDYVDIQHTTPATGHSFGDWIYPDEYDCTLSADIFRVCTVCSAEERDTVQANIFHDFSSYTELTPAGCTQGAHNLWSCSRCSATEIRYGDPLGHSYTAVVTAPTCTDKGFTTYTCIRCDDSYIDSYVDAVGHKYVSVVTPPKAEEMGYTTHTCSICGDSYKDSYTEPTGHNPVLQNQKAATCTEDGYTGDWICADCGKVMEKGSAISATGHSFGAWTEVKATTCTADGSEKRVCDCGEEENRSVAALGHAFQDEITPPTCVYDGFTAHKCVRCNAEYLDNYVPALGHDYESVITPPTATEQGFTTHTCSVCGDSYVDGYTDPTGPAGPNQITSGQYTVTDMELSKVALETTVEAFLRNLNEGTYCKVYKNGREVAMGAYVGTGMTVQLIVGEEVRQELTILVKGDSNGDGQGTVTDMLSVKAHVLEKSLLQGAALKAADVNGDGSISITDFILLKAHVLGKDSIKP